MDGLGIEGEEIDRTERAYREQDEERLHLQSTTGDLRAGIERLIRDNQQLADGECG